MSTLLAAAVESRQSYARGLEILASLGRPQAHGTHDQRTHGRKRRGTEVPKPTAAPKAPAKKVTTRKAGIDWTKRLNSGVASSKTLGDGANQNHVELVEFGDGSRSVVKYSKAGNENGRTEFDAEELGAKVAQAIGLNPPQVHREEEQSAFFSYIHDTAPKALPGGEYGDYQIDADSSLPGKRIGLLDVLIENSDRHNLNWFISDPDDSNSELIPIDHGYAWERSSQIDVTKVRQPQLFEHFLIEEVPVSELPTGYAMEDVYRFADNDLSPAYMRDLRGKLEKLKPEFDRLGRGDWYDRLLARTDIVASHAKGEVSL